MAVQLTMWGGYLAPYAVGTPAGVAGTVREGEDPEQVYSRHVMAAASEGMCPHCLRALNEHRICAPCNKRWTVSATGWEWELCINPHTGEWLI
jgi:hypothetical protein